MATCTGYSHVICICATQYGCHTPGPFRGHRCSQAEVTRDIGLAHLEWLFDHILSTDVIFRNSSKNSRAEQNNLKTLGYVA